jgi:hypothetical protein
MKEMNKKVQGLVEWIISFVVFLLAILLIVFVAKYVEVAKINEELYQDNLDLEFENAEAEITMEWMDEYIELLDDIYRGKMNEAVLEERIKWLETQDSLFDYDYAKQMFEDFVITIEAAEDFGAVNNDFITYFEEHYPNVWERMLQYDDLF